MRFLKTLFYPVELSDEEKADQEEQQWYDDYNDWCSYDEETNQCTSSKVVISDHTIIGKLFNMFNEFLVMNKDAIIKYNKVTRFSMLYSTTMTNGIYCISENIAKQFITKIVRDDWNIYLQLNELYNKYRFINDTNNYYVPLDVFVYGFSKYHDLMEVLTFDEQPIPDMPLQSKQEPEKNVYVPPRKIPNTNTFIQSPELKTFDIYLKKTPGKKKEYLMKVSDKLKNYWKSLRKKNKKYLLETPRSKSLLKESNANQQSKITSSTVDKVEDDDDDDEIKVDENYVRRKLNINTSIYNKDFGGIIKDGGKKERSLHNKKTSKSNNILKKKQIQSKNNKTKSTNTTK